MTKDLDRLLEIEGKMQERYYYNPKEEKEYDSLKAKIESQLEEYNGKGLTKSYQELFDEYNDLLSQITTLRENNRDLVSEMNSKLSHKDEQITTLTNERDKFKEWHERCVIEKKQMIEQIQDKEQIIIDISREKKQLEEKLMDNEITVTGSKIFCPKCDYQIQIYNHQTSISPNYQLEQYKAVIEKINDIALPDIEYGTLVLQNQIKKILTKLEKN